MPKFTYTAKETTGKTIKGEIVAPDKKQAVDMLRKRDFLILKLEKGKKAFSFKSLLSKKGKAKVKSDDMVIFTRQLSTMIGAGMTIVNSLDTLAEQTEKNPAFRNILRDIKESINTGSSLSEAMAKYTYLFSEYFVNMVKAGESSGMLDSVLVRISDYMEKTNILNKKVKSAMVYPAIVSSMAVIITLVMIIKVIPVFKEMFDGFGATLPKPTEFLIALSDALRSFFVPISIVLVGFYLLLQAYSRTKKGTYLVDKFKLNAIVFGPLIRKVAISKFTRTLSALVRSGVPILSALDIVKRTAGNVIIEDAIMSVKESVKEGESIALPLEKSGIFPPLVTKMVAVGEKSGQLEGMLEKISDFYDQQVDAAVDGLTSLIEPLVIAFLGVIIGGIVICMFLPIFKLSSIVNS